jgi:hypothetical protein
MPQRVRYDVRAKLCIGDCPRKSLRGPFHRGLGARPSNIPSVR